MKNQTLVPGKVDPSTTIDFTSELGYGLIFQPVIASSTPLQKPFITSFFFVHRRPRRSFEMHSK